MNRRRGDDHDVMPVRILKIVVAILLLHPLVSRPGGRDWVVAEARGRAGQPSGSIGSRDQSSAASGGDPIMARFGIEGIRYFGAARAAGVSTAEDLTYVFNVCNGLDSALRDFHAAPKPWSDELQYEEDVYDLLKQIGFDLVWVREAPFVTVHLPSIDSLLTSKLAWPLRRLTVEAMTPETRAAFYVAVRDRTRRFANADGSFDWSPSLFRVFATL
jgi:hypothetical protein